LIDVAVLQTIGAERYSTCGFARLVGIRVLCGFPQPPSSSAEKNCLFVIFRFAVGAVVTVGKPERFLRRLFQAAVEIIKKKLPQAPLLISTAAAVSTARFFFGSFFFFFFDEFPLWNNRTGRVTNTQPPLFRQLSQTFERDQHGELDICSDDVLRGLAIRIMQLSAGRGFQARERWSKH
jgi:hypothetical protein